MNQEQLLNQAQSLKKAGRLQEAAAAFEKLCALYPNFPPLLNDLGILYFQQGNFNGGEELLKRSLSLDSKQSMIFYSLGRAYQTQEKLNEAVSAFKQVTKLQPDFIEGYFSLGICLHSLELFADATDCFDEVIKKRPDAAHAQNAKGVSLYHSGNYTDALVALQKALNLNPQSPEIFNNLGLAFHKLNEFNEALANYNQALAINASYADAYSNRGLTYQALQKSAEALKDYDKCIQLEPTHSDAHWNKALTKIQLGEYQEGWALYEWRWKSFSRKWARHYDKPLWLGEESLQGKTIFIYPEQGFGDFIQFYRYIPKLQALGAQIILETPKALKSLITGSSTEIEIVEVGEKSSEFDFQCPIMSLPFAFKTGLDSIPSIFPYLKVNPEKIKTWQEKLGPANKKRVGIAWSGSKEHKNDHNRSIALSELSSLLQMPLEFHSLQKEIRESDQAFLENSPIRNHQDAINDFSDTAALIENMDLVITVDTAIAHLTGSLNKPFLLLLPHLADYRWMLDRKDSPWYPTADLFRQTKLGNWERPIRAMIHELL